MKLPCTVKINSNIFELLNKYRSSLMGFAALWILLFHEWLPVFTNYRLLSLGERFIKRIGFCGVDIFLFLSGIGMVYSLERSKSLYSFYLKRIKRILFPFIAIAIFRCCLEDWTFSTFIKNISGINFYTESILSFLWFVPAIITFYLVFPFYYRLFAKSSNKFIFTLCTLTIWLIASLVLRETMRKDLFGFTNRIPIFVIGVFTGWLSQNKKISFDKLTWLFMFLLLFLGLYLSFLTNYRDMYLLVPISNCCIPNILISISLPFLLLGFFDWISQIRGVEKAGAGLIKLLSFYGTFTLELYCVQEWLGGIIMSKLIDHCHNLLINIIILLFLTLTALLMQLISKHIWILGEYLIRKTFHQHK